jgi:hypothetical protein
MEIPGQISAEIDIEKLIIGNMRRAKIIALVRTGIHEARL